MMYVMYGPVAVGVFFCIVGAYVFLTDQELGTLSRLLVAAVGIAVASQLGKHSFDIPACAIMAAAVIYAIAVVRKTLLRD